MVAKNLCAIALFCVLHVQGAESDLFRAAAAHIRAIAHEMVTLQSYRFNAAVYRGKCERLTVATEYFIPLLLDDDPLVHDFFDTFSTTKSAIRPELRIMLVAHLADGCNAPREARIRAIQNVLSSGRGNKAMFSGWYLYPDVRLPKKTDKDMLTYVYDTLNAGADAEFVAFVAECNRIVKRLPPRSAI